MVVPYLARRLALLHQLFVELAVVAFSVLGGHIPYPETTLFKLVQAVVGITETVGHL